MANKILIGLIVGLIIGLIIGGAISYLIFNGQRGPRGNFNNFQLNETQINELTSFFNSNHTSGEINSYCEQNRMNCMYYCKNINQNNEICKNMTMPPGGQQWSP
jgi:hypothetical protein